VAFGQSGYKIDSAPAPAAGDVPKALLDALDPAGSRLLNSGGTTVAEVWWRKSIATQSSPTSSDVVYGNIPPGAMIGLIHFPAAGSDFRGQAIKPGYYTLRYANVPQDGNHMGVSTYRDFALLSPVAADSEIDQALKFDDLVKLSRQASGTNHPAVMSLVPAGESNQNFPALVQDKEGHSVLQVKVHANPEVRIAIVLVGQAQS